MARAVNLQLIDREVLARCEQAGLSFRKDIDGCIEMRALLDRLKVRDVDGLLDVELTRLAVLAEAAVVVDAVRRVGILLNLADDDALADGVQRARGDEKDIPLVNGYLVADLEQRVIGDALLEFLLRDAVLEAIDQRGARLAVDDVPHLRLAVLPLDAHRVIVVRMDLHREVVLRIDELDEQREVRELLRVLAEDSGARLIEIRLERAARLRTILDDAHAILVAGEFPRLRDLLEVRLLAVVRLELRAAPDVILERCL